MTHEKQAVKHDKIFLICSLYTVRFMKDFKACYAKEQR